MASGPGRWSVLVLAAGLMCPPILAAEIYIWTDDAGVVHMTDQWVNVPPAAHSRVTVRESTDWHPAETPTPHEPLPTIPPSQPPTLQLPPLHMSPDISDLPASDAQPTTVVEGHVPHRHPLKQRGHPSLFHPRTLDRPFPFNVQLDPVDPDFLRIGQSRVHKDALRYPRISLEDESKLQARLRMLQQKAPSSQKPPQTRPPRP